jgi:hypothetical protein
VNPIDELASLLPPAPPSRDLPHRDQHEADLLALIGADLAAEAPRPSRLRSSWRGPSRWLSSSRLSSWRLPSSRGPQWLAPSAAAIAVACAVVIVAIAAIALPGLSGSHRTPGPRPSQPPATGRFGAPNGSSLTVTRHWTVRAGSFTSVRVSTNNGPVTVTGSTAASAAVTAAPSYSGAAPMISYHISDRALTVRATCPQEGHCQVALQLQVPAGVPVRASTDLGAVRLTGLRSGAVADSQLGNIYLSRLAGLVTAQTQLGQVSATGLAAYRATLTTAEGSVDAAFSVAPELVTASSQLGSVTLQLPSGTSYAVTATADMGSASVTVPQSRVSRHVVKASSQLGSVIVAG